MVFHKRDDTVGATPERNGTGEVKTVPQPLSTDEIRRRFVSFFAAREHWIAPSDSLVPTADPSLLFTGAGMNRFKEHFLGRAKLEHPRQRAAGVQKCIRTGDIENVGRTPHHHTFFEMLGNFSFGDYFKAEAIAWAWEFLTSGADDCLDLEKERLSVTIFGGDEKRGLPHDEEAEDAWKKVAPELRNADGTWRIHGCGEHDNFWPADAPSKGPNGLCGPCSEIYYDLKPEAGAPVPVTEDEERYTEIWNLVFTQFDRRDGGALEPLPQRNIDTGAGLERIARVMQRRPTNFDIDLLRPVVETAAEIAGVKYGADKEQARLLRRISDHVRAGVFCIADGVTPKNEGRNYVVRRLLRRAVLDGRALGIEGLFLKRVALKVVEQMKIGYPELAPRAKTLARLIEEEEKAFSRTLRQGEAHFTAAVAATKKKGEKILSGPVVFRLFDTFGFPLEVTAEHAAELGFSVDEKGFETELARARERSRKGAGFAKEIFVGGPAAVLREKSAGRPTVFEGYERTCSEGVRVLALLVEEQPTDSAETGTATVLLDRTPFYGEAGGQVGDVGRLTDSRGTAHRVTNSGRLGDLILHEVELGGSLAVGETVTAEVKDARREAVRRNHSATHLLHLALRRVLGDHVEQRGSLVASDRLRFDFTHFAQPTAEELARVEMLVNEQIVEDLPVQTVVTSPEEAKAAGATALFGEKYGEKVRVVTMGQSMELCGGTHVERTGKIGCFRLVSESALAAGVRRVEALTGPAAVAEARAGAEKLAVVARILKTGVEDVVARAEALQEERRSLSRELAALKRERVRATLGDLLRGVKESNGAKLLTAQVEAEDAKDLREVAAELRRQASEVALALGAAVGGKAALLISLPDEWVKRGAHAGQLVKEAAALVGGGGGGRPETAQAGGKQPEKLPEALAAAEKYLREIAAKSGG